VMMPRRWIRDPERPERKWNALMLALGREWYASVVTPEAQVVQPLRAAGRASGVSTDAVRALARKWVARRVA
jgi:hypothetical protein